MPPLTPIATRKETIMQQLRQLLMAIFCLFAGADLATAAQFVVNNTADEEDFSSGDGVCETAPGNGVCTLRAAIEEANATAATDTIAFNIPGSGPYTIRPTSALPTITDPVTIDGTTQPGFAGTPIIELDGS